MAVVLLSEFPFAPRRFLIPTSCATMFETRNSRAAIIVVRMVLAGYWNKKSKCSYYLHYK